MIAVCFSLGKRSNPGAAVRPSGLPAPRMLWLLDCFVARAPRNDGWVAADPIASVVIGRLITLEIAQQHMHLHVGRKVGHAGLGRQPGDLAGGGFRAQVFEGTHRIDTRVSLTKSLTSDPCMRNSRISTKTSRSPSFFSQRSFTKVGPIASSPAAGASLLQVQLMSP